MFFVENKPFMDHGTKLKVGILGGTFNPPHVGHLRLAEEVASLHGLLRVIFVPSFIPPHKTTEEIAPANDRLEMTRLACTDNPRFEVSDMEIAAKGPSYTVNTLETLAQRADREYFFILGTDSLREIHTWKDYQRLFTLAHFIVVKRPGIEFTSAWTAIPADLKSQFSDHGDHLVHSCSKSLIRSRIQGLDMSATGIRNLVATGLSIRYLVTDAVLSYIVQNRLYRN